MLGRILFSTPCAGGSNPSGGAMAKVTMDSLPTEIWATFITCRSPQFKIYTTRGPALSSIIAKICRSYISTPAGTMNVAEMPESWLLKFNSEKGAWDEIVHFERGAPFSEYKTFKENLDAKKAVLEIEL